MLQERTKPLPDMDVLSCSCREACMTFSSILLYHALIRPSRDKFFWEGAIQRPESPRSYHSRNKSKIETSILPPNSHGPKFGM
jgi:hypothetical protein